MIPTQHAPGNNAPTAPTPAPAPAPVGAGAGVADRYTATAAEPYYTHPTSNGRLVDAFYLLPGQAERTDGDYLDAAELSICHHKDAKCYRATLSATSIQLQGGMFGQRFSLFAARSTTQVLSTAAARFHAATYAQFTTDVHAQLAARRTAEGDQSRPPSPRTAGIVPRSHHRTRCPGSICTAGPTRSPNRSLVEVPALLASAFRFAGRWRSPRRRGMT